MIPKIIHYCWFGRTPLPPLAQKCIKSWKKYLPDYEIKEWNEDNFNINILPYTKEAYEEKKYAFVSDYARFWILYNYGGLYFDTDVEIIKELDDIIERGAFMGCETKAIDSILAVAPGLGLGCEPNHEFYKEILEVYSKLNFKNSDKSLNLKTIVEYTTELLYFYGLRNIDEIQRVRNIHIYPVEYFCPDYQRDGILRITENTRSIHYYAASWLSPQNKIRKNIKRIMKKYLGGKITSLIVHLRRTIRNYNTKLLNE